MTPIVSELFLRTQSDARLVSLARAGHSQAFVAIVGRYQHELLVYARRSGPQDRAEDVVQQALLNAYSALRGGTEVSHLRGWLYAIVRRTLARVAAGEPLRDGDAETMAVSEPLEDVVLRRARARDTLVALRDLPARQREALLATEFAGHSRSEVALALGDSEGAVRQLVHRARVNVRRSVGALVPYPVLRWMVNARGSGVADGPASELAASAAVASSGGLVAKIGIVLASGVVASGAFVLPGTTHHARARHVVRAPAARLVAGVAARPAVPAPIAGVPVARRSVAGAVPVRHEDRPRTGSSGSDSSHSSRDSGDSREARGGDGSRRQVGSRGGPGPASPSIGGGTSGSGSSHHDGGGGPGPSTVTTAVATTSDDASGGHVAPTSSGDHGGSGSSDGGGGSSSLDGGGGSGSSDGDGSSG